MNGLGISMERGLYNSAIVSKCVRYKPGVNESYKY